MSPAGAPPVVLLAHGSPDPRHAEGIEALAVAVRELYEGPVRTAYLDHHPPSVRDVADELAGADRVVIVPALLGRGFHWRVDVPEAAAAFGAGVVVTDVLDDSEALAAAAVEIAQAQGWVGDLVLVNDRGDGTTVRAAAPGEPVGAVARTLCSGVLADRALLLAAEAGQTALAGELARTSALRDLVLRRVGNAEGADFGYPLG